MKPIRTERLILRNWEERDRDLFFRINSDETVMEFFPFRRDRAKADAKMDEIRAENTENGYGWMAAEIAATGDCIGFIGLHDAEIERRLPARSRSAGGWHRNSGARAMSLRVLLHCSISASTHSASRKSSPSPSRKITAPPPSWNASACAASHPATSIIPKCPTRIRN